MNRSTAVIGAPSSLGVRPYEDGQAQHLDWAPGVLRERGLIARLDAVDMGDVVPPVYRDYERPSDRPRNEEGVITYSRAIGERVAAVIHHGRFALVLGGDCAIVLGCLIGARRTIRGPVGLAYVDAHADFATPEESRTGSVAGMALSLAVGRGRTPLARLAGRQPLVDAREVAVLGRRDIADGWRGHAALAASPILDIPDEELMANGFVDVTAAALARVAFPDVVGFWVHLDADVLNPAVMPAVDSPEPGGLMPGELVSLLAPLVSHRLALGLSLSSYDPALDPDRSCARRLVGLLEMLLRVPVMVDAPVPHHQHVPT
jgi:arginase